jgi:hypothetical protein
MRIAFALFDSTGAPLAGAGPSFYRYVNAVTGAPITSPLISDLGGGLYAFDVADADLAGGGVAYLVDGGASAAPRYSGGGQGNNSVVVLPYFNSDGTPSDTGTVGVGFDRYRAADGSLLTLPTLNNLGPDFGLWSFVPSAADISARACFVVSSDSNPQYYTGQVELSVGGGFAPTISNATPVGSPLSRGGPIQFDVTDPDNNAVSVFVSATFLGKNDDERVFSPEGGFAARYAASTVTAITGGWRFVLSRAGGWPAPPRIRVEGVDSTGVKL